jgi:hypothetical protein
MSWTTERVIETGAVGPLRETVGQRPTLGRRLCRALSGGSPDGRAAAARPAGASVAVALQRRHDAASGPDAGLIPVSPRPEAVDICSLHV